MKIFWSWQSDTPGKTGRHFIREVLKDALEELKVEDELDEPMREELHLDHDRKGIPGSPDLAKAILEKIKLSAVFVADVTLIGKTDDGKLLVNSNVAIELGYALPFVEDAGLLMVFNEAYGDRESLPFDLRHKAGPITYNLPDNANKDQIATARAPLVAAFRNALRDCLKAKRVVKNSASPKIHNEISATGSCAEYFNYGEALVKRNISGLANDCLLYGTDALIYLRLIPQEVLSHLRESEITDLIFGIKVPPLRSNIGGGSSHSRNKYGGMTFSFESNDRAASLLTSTQIFRNRELWGIDSTLLSKGKYIPSKAYEDVLSAGLRSYLKFAAELLEYKCPIIVEAGAAGVEGFKMAMGSNEYWGPITLPEIKSRHKLVNFDAETVDTVLLKIFEDFFDATGSRRPKGFNGFPATGTS